MLRQKNYVEKWIENGVTTVFVWTAISIAWMVSWVNDVLYISTLAADILLEQIMSFITNKFQDRFDYLEKFEDFFKSFLIGLGIYFQVVLRLDFYLIFKILLFPLGLFETFLTAYVVSGVSDSS